MKQALENAVAYARDAKLSLIEPSVSLNTISPVAPHIFISSRNGAIQQMAQLSPMHNIRQVVSMSMIPLTNLQALGFKANGVTYSSFPINDVAQQSLNPEADYIDQNILIPAYKGYGQGHTGRVLVVCDAGMSRSVSIVMWHLMKTYRWNYEHTLDWIRKFRSFAQPNPGFEAQLRALEKNAL